MVDVGTKIKESIENVQVCAISKKPIPLDYPNVVYWQLPDKRTKFALLEEWNKQSDAFKKSIRDESITASWEILFE